MTRFPFLMFITLLLSAALLLSCDNEDIVNTADPSNLKVEITVSADGSGKTTILATADNTVEYQLRVGSVSDPTATNTTGNFEYTFIQGGTHQIEVRAYGQSGKYLKENRQILIILASDTVSPSTGYSTPMQYEGYTLVWNDEFSGTQLNPSFWTYEIGNGCPNLCGWGNNELQYYKQENAWVADGLLVIEARKETVQNNQYTSARIKTQGKKSFKYGRIDIRAVMPKGQGIWPALWMLGNNITSVGWPKCGEIDIMEMVGGNGRENQTHGTVHWDNNGHVHAGGSYTLASGIFADAYHVFSIIWDATLIKFLVNDIQFYQINITPDHMTEFHHEFFFVFNVAVGGNWPGSPNATTVFPQQMKVDYVRVFQKN